MYNDPYTHIEGCYHICTFQMIICCSHSWRLFIDYVSFISVLLDFRNSPLDNYVMESRNKSYNGKFIRSGLQLVIKNTEEDTVIAHSLTLPHKWKPYFCVLKSLLSGIISLDTSCYRSPGKTPSHSPTKPTCSHQLFTGEALTWPYEHLSSLI